MTSGKVQELHSGGEPGPPHATVEQAQATLRLRRRERLRMLPMVAASYIVDSALLCAYVVSGVLTWQVPAAYLASGLALSAAFYLVLNSGLPERLRDHHLVMSQMVAHSVLQMLFLVWAPQVGVPFMMLCFVIFAFGALRMKFRTVVFGSTALALAMGLVIVSMPGTVGLPFATPLERATGGLWFAIILSRLAFVGQHGAHLRALLTEQRALLTAALAKVERLASRDELTGAMNRRAIVGLVRDEQERMKRSGTAFAVALFDIDLFKQVNDGHGHLIGDGVLRRFCVAAEKAIRTTDRLGRFGGEEFLVLMPATDRLEAALAAAERVREAVARADWAALDKNLQVTVSAGVSVATAEDSLETLLGRADGALYAAKRDGRNRVCSA
ncbi:MAG: GGDEF domain-containing protein [Pseudomonadota bacterium]|nr:GGDEF domain-containing protein [Pseudomonadota bacterium]